MTNNAKPTSATVDHPPSDAFAFDAIQDIDNVEAPNAPQLRALDGIGAACAWTATGDEAQVRLSGRSAGKSNLDALLRILDQIALGVKSMVQRGRDPMGRPTIEFEMTQDRQSRFLDMADGQDAVLHVTCLGTDAEWQRLRVRNVIWNRRPV